VGEGVKRSFVVTATHYRSGEVREFTVRDDRIVAERAVRSRTKPGLLFGPGLVDLQCNGYSGVDFNHPATTVEQIRSSIRSMWRDGCTVVLPTVITAPRERLSELFDRLVKAVEAPEIAQTAPGFHLEGPFISPEDGARGAHPLAAVSPPDSRLWKAVQKAAAGRIALLTLAPETKGAFRLIPRLREKNILPAIGHTMATTAQISAAADAGAMMSTHLGNGCPQQIPRHANPIFAQLGEDRLAASVIPDGIHLPPEVIRSIARVKGPERTVIVTDAMAAAAAPPGRYTIGDLVVEVGGDRVVRQPGSSNFAGSALTMNEAVIKYCRMTGRSLAESWDAASRVPLRLLSEAGKLGQLDCGTIIVDADERGFSVIATFRKRRMLWADESLAE
jgi:N-acetylglucosamine-6-phosphate deacetylase